MEPKALSLSGLAIHFQSFLDYFGGFWSRHGSKMIRDGIQSPQKMSTDTDGLWLLKIVGPFWGRFCVSLPKTFDVHLWATTLDRNWFGTSTPNRWDSSFFDFWSSARHSRHGGGRAVDNWIIPSRFSMYFLGIHMSPYLVSGAIQLARSGALKQFKE